MTMETSNSQADMPPVEQSETPIPDFLRPKFSRIPQELKVIPNWVLWVPRWSGTKWTKRPIQPSGYGANTTNRKQWSSFEAVELAYNLAVQRGFIEVHQKGEAPKRVPIGGIGFVFDGSPGSDGLVYAGVDFDKVIKNGSLTSLAAERIKRINSYTELSVSDTGLHVIVKARPLQRGVSSEGVEVYTHGRFFTMTGHAPANATIIAAPDAIDALVAELQSSSGHSSSAGTGPEAPKEEQREVEWFDRLRPEQCEEVLKYATNYLAEHSNCFKLTKDGGNYADYLRVALALARSGIDAAEDIFVGAASEVSGADPEADLRRFFEQCKKAERRDQHVTVATLFFEARKYGADFDHWRENDDTIIYAPGREQWCRERLDRAVAEDPLTFTLGGRSGPLVVLRVPLDEDLPAHTKWDGDLPGASLATAADIMLRAERLAWMKDGKSGLYRITPPRSFISDYIQQMQGRYGARILHGVARVPRMDASGEIDFVHGYDAQTGLYHDRKISFPALAHPTLSEARNAVEILSFPFSEYRFDNAAAGQAIVLAAMFTAIERAFLRVAPMFVIRSALPGTGKGLLVRSLVRLAFDTTPTVITWGGSSEEFEKRLGALLLQAPAALTIDNANGMHIKGDLLEAILTEGVADIRPLGRSETVKIRNRSLMLLTGNNPIITGDMARRALPIDILPRSSDPERDKYSFNPAELVQRRRQQLLATAYTAMKAYRKAGMPEFGLPGVGSYDEWARRVRDLVYWLTDYDVSEAFSRNKAEDPRRQDDAALVAALHRHFGSNAFIAADVVAVHKKVSEFRRNPNNQVQSSSAENALHAAIENVFGLQGSDDAQRIGNWARKVKGMPLGGQVLETRHNAASNANEIIVRQVSPGAPGVTGLF
jgi:hypothetical protein